MKSKHNVSNTEWEVLKMLWKHGAPIRRPELLGLFQEEGRSWKRQTLNTFVSRLQTKGLLRMEGNFVVPVYTEEEYRTMQMKEAIGTLYGGKISNVLAAFMKQNELSKEEAEELRQLLNENTDR